MSVKEMKKAKKVEMAEQIADMIANMSPAEMADLMAEYDPALVARRSINDFPDPGPEVRAGDDGATGYSEMSLLEQAVFERIIGVNNLLPVHFLEEGAVVQRAVCRVNVPGQWRGTGFMVSPTLMLTNNHVIPSVAIANSAQAEFNFQTTYQGVNLALDPYTLNPASVFRTNAALDYTLVRVRAKCQWLLGTLNPVLSGNGGNGGGETWQEVGSEFTPGPDGPDLPGIPGIPGLPGQPIDLPVIPFPRDPFLPPFRICTNAGTKYGHVKLRKTIAYVTNEYLNIIQHPSGNRKQVALQDNTLSNIFTNHIRYTSDTEPGSSGSPVFDNRWDLLALHHAAGEFSGGVWVSNQGVRIDKIAADLISHFSGVAGGAAVLTELGLA
jgi:hypothetical protein